MVRRISALLVPAIAVIGFALPSAQADHGCNGTVTDVGGAAYIDDRDITAGGVWVYLESNGTAGLQSGGDSVLLGDADSDPCEHANPDTLVI